MSKQDGFISPSSDSTVSLNPDGKIQTVIQSRVKKASEFLGNVEEKDLFEFLTKIGIDDTPQGLQLLDSDVAAVEVLEQEFSSFTTVPTLKRKAVVAILKGTDPFKKDPPKKEVPVKSGDDVLGAILATRNISQMKDIELLEMYDKTRDLEAEDELSRRSKNNRFIILKGEKYEPGKEAISIELSLDQLRRARKGYVIPSMVPVGDGKIAPVYRITELNPEDRIVEICPICGEILYKGYCSKCELDFSGVEDEARIYVKLVVNCEKFDPKSHSDRKAVHASAVKGLADLRSTWPSIAPTFDELKLTGSLPRLRMLRNMPAVKVADPFHKDGNRTY